MQLKLSGIRTTKGAVLLSLSIIVLVFMILLSVNIWTRDFQLAHKSIDAKSGSFDWIGYDIELGSRKFLRSIIGENKKGLQQVRLYISEHSQQSLMSDIPESTKVWQQGYILRNGALQNIKVRHKGDNHLNWMLYKKAWKIKTKKDEMFGLDRVFDFHVPQNYNFEREYSPLNIANRMGVLAPKVQLVELFINDESSGIYIKSEVLNESFLRRNNIMPVNLYKGEQTYREINLGLFYDLFNNTSLWTKKAYFNNQETEDKSDLQNFLLLIREAETDDLALEELFKKVDIEVWSKFMAFQAITQSFSSDFRHNQRLVIDPWSGIVHPIVQDPTIGETFFNDTMLPHVFDNPEEIRRDYLWLMMNRSSRYINKKYQYISHYTRENPVLLEEARHIKSIEKLIDISSSRDIDSETKLNLSMFRDASGKINNEIKSFANALLLFNDYIIKKLYNKPNSVWVAKEGEDEFIIMVNGILPISDIIISFEESPPEWVAIDLNGDHIINSKDIKIYSDRDSNTIEMPVTLYANRITVGGIGLQRDIEIFEKRISIANTGFEFIASNSMKIQSISASNPFSGERITLKNRQIDYVLPSRLNTPIVNDKDNIPVKNEIILSGIVNITDDMHIRNPVVIMPGTIINIDASASLIFHNKVTARGTPKLPIIINRKDVSQAWGTVALQGEGTSGSVFSNIDVSGGSGDFVKGIYYTSMFSLHNTSNISIETSTFHNNEKYDDMLHVVYGDNIKLDYVTFRDAVFDAIDIDMSTNIILNNIKVTNAGNDAIDFMGTEALVDKAYLYRSGDKGISVGENSNILVYDSLLSENKIGLASKDGSSAKILDSVIDSNSVQISAYQKNWRYGAGGDVLVFRSRIINGRKNFDLKNFSDITVVDSVITGSDSYKNEKNVKIFTNCNSRLLGEIVNHPLYDDISTTDSKSISCMIGSGRDI